MADDKGLEWEQVEVLEGKGSQRRVKCLHCLFTFTGGATRIRCHLLAEKGGGVQACSKPPADVCRQLKAALKEKAQVSGTKRGLEEEEAAAAAAARAARANTAGPGPGSRGGVMAAFARNTKPAADKAVARCFYARAAKLVQVFSNLRVMEALGRPAPMVPWQAIDEEEADEPDSGDEPSEEEGSAADSGSYDYSAGAEDEEEDEE